MVVMLAFSSQAACYIVGDAPFGGWNPGEGVEMTLNGDGSYSYTTAVNGTIYFVFATGLDSNWDTFNSTYRHGPSGSDAVVVIGEWMDAPQGGDKAYKLTGNGSEYVFTFNPYINKCKVDGYEVPPVPIETYTVAGTPAAIFGTEWDPTNVENDMAQQADGTFALTKYNCQLAGSELEFKVTGNHSWDNAWPDNNVVVSVEEAGLYDVTFIINPENKDVTYNVVKSGEFDPRTGELYILGEVNGNGWDPSNGVKMDTEDENIFTAQIVTAGENPDEDGTGYSFFSFTTKLSESSEDWSSIGGYRIGALEDAYLMNDDMMGIEVGLSNFGQTNSFKIPAGEYEVTVNLDAKTMVINKVEPQPEIYTIEKVWSIDDLSFLSVGDVRQGFGMNGKFYINDKANQKVIVVDENGLTNTEYPGGANCGITRDEAGNLIISTAAFPDAWTAEATIKVINPETNETKEYTVPEECGILGRCDFLGFAKGNLMENGFIYLTGATNSGVSVLSIGGDGGEVIVDECYPAPCDGLTPTSSTVINYYQDLAGEDALLYVTRNAVPLKLTLDDGDGLVGENIVVPGKGACNGMFPLIWDGKEYFVYPTLPNYQNGFAVGEAGAEAPIVEVPTTVAANANAYQANWLNAEVDEFGVVTIYQYYPGGNIAVYRLTSANIPEPEQTEAPVISTEVTEDGVIITATGEGEVHLYVNGEEVENPYTIARGEEDVTVVVTATAKDEGKLISETTTLEVVVPAKEVEPESGYKIEKVWEINDLSFLTVGDVRQGFGMDGKFYINDKANQKVIVVDENGLTNTEYPGGANCGITRDEAGNLVISNAAFPDAWSAEATIKVVNPETNEVKEYVVPEECGMAGRCDFIGFAKGNLMEDGVIYLTGATNTGVSVMTIAGGEVNTDECYAAACDGLTPSTSTVINYYTDLAGEDALLYVTRNAALAKLAFEGDDLAATTFTLPNKGACNGTFPFIWDEKEFFVYPTLPNYQNGFAVAEANAEAPIAEIESTVTANANAFTSNWLNAEIDEAGVLIYQYYPGGNIAVYRLTKVGGGVEELINDSEKVVAGVRYYNIMGQEMNEANGITIVVTTYTDGSHSAVKVIK